MLLARLGRLTMGMGKAGVIGLAGGLMGLVLGYTLWGLPVDALTSTLEMTRAELLKTQGWLRDEIRTSDERHEQVSKRLEKALAGLARARAQLAQTSAASPSPPAGGSPGQPAGAGPGEVARSPD
jgi:hypothetical protein